MNGKTLPHVIGLEFCCNIWIVGSEFGVNNMDPSCLASKVQAGCYNVTVWRIFSWHTFGLSIPNKLVLNLYQQPLRLEYSNTFLVNEFTVLKWLYSYQILKLLERQISIMDVEWTNLQRLRDAIVSIWNKISEERFQHLCHTELSNI